jgi:hypothetical protein
VRAIPPAAKATGILAKKMMKSLRSVAKKLDLAKDEFSVRFNAGGIAGSGEATLHGENIYITVSQLMGRPTVMYRSCKGQKDFSGGSNNFISVEDIESEHGIKLYSRTILIHKNKAA